MREDSQHAIRPPFQQLYSDTHSHLQYTLQLTSNELPIMSVMPFAEQTTCADPMVADPKMSSRTSRTTLPDPSRIELVIPSGSLQVNFAKTNGPSTAVFQRQADSPVPTNVYGPGSAGDGGDFIGTVIGNTFSQVFTPLGSAFFPTAGTVVSAQTRSSHPGHGQPEHAHTYAPFQPTHAPTADNVTRTGLGNHVFGGQSYSKNARVIEGDTYAGGFGPVRDQGSRNGTADRHHPYARIPPSLASGFLSGHGASGNQRSYHGSRTGMSAQLQDQVN